MPDPALDDLSRRVGEALQAAGVTLVSAESCTGGWIGAALTAIPGSSVWFDRGYITYSNGAKREMLGVPGATLDAYGAVSAQTVAAMTGGALERSPAGVAVAVSGIAGPGGGSPAKPVGLVWIAWQRRGEPPICHHGLFAGDRDAVRRQAVQAALHGVLSLLSHTLAPE